MSADFVDNVEYAEGLLAQYAPDALKDYCRPTCRAEGSADEDDCRESGGRWDCGCPCHEREGASR